MTDKFDTSMEALKKLLDKEYEWPARYPFRFVMPLASVEDFSKLFPQENLQTRFSQNAKYVAVHFEILAEDADAIIEIYLKVKSIQGVISL